MLNKYIVTVQELHEKRYLVSNAVAPQQAQEWIEIHIDDDLSDLLEQNIKELDSEYVTEGRNNIVESLRDIKIKKLCSHNFCNCEDRIKNNTELIKNNNMGCTCGKIINLGCTCGYDEEEVCGKDEDGNRAEMKLDCPDDKCDCNS